MGFALRLNAGQHVQIESDFLIRMRFAQRRDDGGDDVGADKRFQADFRDGFQPPGRADGRVRAGAAQECAGAGDAKAARGIVADMTGPGVKEGTADRVDMLGRNESDELEIFPGRRRFDALQRPPVAHVDQVRQAIVGATSGRVERGVRRIDRQVLPDRGERGMRRVKLSHRPKDRRMIGDDRVAFFPRRLGNDGVGHVNGQHRPIQRPSRIADDEADIVPRLGQPRGSDGLHGRRKIRDGGHEGILQRAG